MLPTTISSNARRPTILIVKILSHAVLVLCVSLLAGCATVHVSLDREPPLRKKFPEISVEPVAQKVAELYEVARRAESGAIRGDAEAQQAYAEAVIALVREAAQNKASTPGPSSPALVQIRSTGGLDVTLADELLPARSVRSEGLREQARRQGFGVPYAVVFDHGNPALKNEPGVPMSGMVVPYTAVARFDGKQGPRIEFLPSLLNPEVRVRGRDIPLAGDFSTALALQLSRGRNRSLDLLGMLFTDRSFGATGLYQFQPIDPNKRVVVLVHGLMSRPETWAQAVNRLLADPEINENFQFWFYLYPTGLPVWASAAKLRDELDRFDSTIRGRVQPAVLRDRVVVGHSMGGLISNLLVRDGGKSLWSQFSDASPENLPISDQFKVLIQKVIFFEARRDISRVVFMAVPHRGSPVSMRPISSVGAGLIRLPFDSFVNERRNLLLLLREDTRQLFAAPANSIRFLRPNSPLLLAALNLPVPHDVKFHSVIGDRGRGDTPESSDGIVPYWSSHLEEVVSEKIVPSNHGVNSHPEGVEELARILKSSLQ